jgi:hypothetical protein
VNNEAELLVNTVADMDDPARALLLVDSYLELRRKHKREFVLPARDTYLRPIIDFVGDDLYVFRMFVLAVRNTIQETYGDASFQYQSLQDFSRKLQTRFAAQKRRNRLQPALDWAKVYMPERDAKERQQWLIKLEQQWVGERLRRLQEAKRLKGAPLTIEQKEKVLEEFWEELDNRIALGDLPSWDALMEE